MKSFGESSLLFAPIRKFICPYHRRMNVITDSLYQTLIANFIITEPIEHNVYTHYSRIHRVNFFYDFCQSATIKDICHVHQSNNATRVLLFFLIFSIVENVCHAKVLESTFHRIKEGQAEKKAKDNEPCQHYCNQCDCKMF